MTYDERLLVYKRDGYRCYICHAEVRAGKKRYRYGRPLATLDHVIPRSRGGKDTVDNVKTCCSACNNEKGDKILHWRGSH